ncbi:hypothetical protein PPTG_12519 [Phytophthora nicotianae INRA-310]|uniref:Uncharacterized protein n=5 Tax=Phytophthora nicotianae TaxID=4792 RepID=W2Q4D0_PHYN3|nr:hypothetical protein PPTG_12519 [Phytophthora nicotianae INRA-310]ETN08002.1 hypothetical protein PPTG_12519 [Phytophthora nicotianae INRA-310]
MIRATLPSQDMDDDVDSTDQVDLTLSKEGAEEFKCLSGRQKDRLFNQLAGSDNPDDELAGLAYRGNTVSIHAYPTPRNQGGDEENCFDEVAKGTVERTGFPVSLIYYIRGGRFPVNLGMRLKLEEREQTFRMALEVEVLETINAVRSALSDALNATIEARRVYVADLLVLSNDSLFITKERKASAQRCKLQRLAMTVQDKAMVEEEETPTRFPQLYMA